MGAFWPAIALALIGIVLVVYGLRTLLNKRVDIEHDDWLSKKLLAPDTRYWLGRYYAGFGLFFVGATCLFFAFASLTTSHYYLTPVVPHLTNSEQRALLKQYREHALRMTTPQLIQAFVATSKQLLEKDGPQVSLEASAYETELYIRKVDTPEVNAAHDALITKYGPCFGIPEGDCRE
jgi:hypothetical protein